MLQSSSCEGPLTTSQIVLLYIVLYQRQSSTKRVLPTNSTETIYHAHAHYTMNTVQQVSTRLHNGSHCRTDSRVISLGSLSVCIRTYSLSAVRVEVTRGCIPVGSDPQPLGTQLAQYMPISGQMQRVTLCCSGSLTPAM
jgi:hypothetical protein